MPIVKFGKLFIFFLISVLTSGYMIRNNVYV
jgi:hypothetical protein